ncbi:phosphate uptake regulator PhoU [Candidatus Woesearchaeota archaeon]|nr:phosphate uptake regulator PhoU [Candidatus Woesearchaeota archaeon]
MKRKLIKIGNSTLLLSVPREWAISNNLSKGDEVEIVMDQDKLTVWCDSRLQKEKLVLDVTEFREMLARLLYAVYKSGIDEVEIRSKDPALIDKIKSVIYKEAAGFEILNEGKDFCTIVNVSGKIEDFHNMVRRLFLVTLTMGQESVTALRKNKALENILYLEQENNRLTTILTRAINKYGSYGFKKIGPIYFIIQELEKVGDQYKYLAQHFHSKGKKLALKPNTIKLLEDASQLLRTVYEFFYTFNPKKVDEIREQRNGIISRASELYAQKLNEDEFVMLHHSLNICTLAFDLSTSIFILKV